MSKSGSAARSPAGVRAVVFYLTLVVCLATAFAVPAWPANGRVLLVSSYHPAFPTFFKQIDGIKSILGPAGVDIDVEFMDSKRFNTPQNIENFRTALKYKLSSLPPYSVVITSDDNALRFVLANKNDLFPGAAVVFCGVNNRDFALEQNNNPEVTGVIEAVSLRETLELIPRLLPSAKRVAVIVDATPSGQADLTHLRSIMPEFADLRFVELSLTGLTFEQLSGRLRELKPEDSVLLLSAYHDAKGDGLDFNASLDLIRASSPRPILHPYEHGLGDGILGGKVISHYHQGEYAGRITLSILDGVRPASIPVTPGDAANAYIFDYNELERFGIDEILLPGGSAVINKSMTFFDVYRPYVISVLAFFISLMVLIVILLKSIMARKSAEERLAQWELERIKYMDYTPDAIVVCDAKGTIVDVNRAAGEMFGMERQELLDLQNMSLMAPDSAVAARVAFARLLDHGTVETELEFKRHDESRFMGLIRAVEVSPDRYLGIIRDVTEMREAQDVLARREEYFRQLFENAPVPYQSLDENGYILAVNRAWLATLGYEEHEVIGTWFGDHLLEEYVDHFDKNFPMFKDACAIDGVSFRMRKKDGGDIHVTFNGRVQTDDKGRFLHTHCVFWDTTEREHYETALRQREFELREALERLSFHVHNSPLAVIEWDGKSRVRRWSPVAEKMFGWTAEEAMGKSWNDLGLVYEEDLPHVSTVLSDMLHGEDQHITIINRNYTKSGRVIHCHWFNSAQYDEHGTPLSIFSQVLDITENKRIETENLAAKEKAERANTVKSQLLANMSHEIRTPLNGMMGMLQLLQTTYMDTVQENYVQATLQSCRRLTTLLSDILDLSKIEAGKMMLADEPFNLQETISSVEELFRPSAESANLSFRVQLHGALPEHLSGDENRLRQVLYNIVGNALKFTQQGGVSVQVQQLPIAKHGYQQVLFIIEDTGIGISDELFENIFDSFSQAETSYVRQFQGAGLGLAIVKHLVTMMSGSICVGSQEGEGSVFYVSLPFAVTQQPEPAMEQTKAAPLTPNFTATVLLVEDEAINRAVTAMLLEKYGFKVVEAADGSQALDLLRDNGGVDCILMDIQMPVMDGLETTNVIRTDPQFQHKAGIPIIALTAYAMPEEQEKFLQAGMNGCVSKPVEIGDLIDVLGELLVPQAAGE